MQRLELMKELAFGNQSKILFWVFDGVGGLPHPETGYTELETARTPHLDAMARRSACGGMEAFGAGITPGSGPGHLALFGYPLEHFDLPRGVLEVLGADEAFLNGEIVRDVALGPKDLAMRGNFASLELRDATWVIGDRRANNITSEESREVCRMLSQSVRLEGYACYFFPGQQHRFAVMVRGENLHGGLSDADPQKSGLPPRQVEALSEEARHAAAIVNELMAKAQAALAGQPKANAVLLRGIGQAPKIPSLTELYGIRCAAIATYPMYKGIARLVGMDVLEVPSMDHADEVRVLEEAFERYDFFYLHIKETDSYAHKFDFVGKVGVLEACDPLFARACELAFDVVVLTGDHCTPAILGDHSWHPVPTALWSKNVLGGGSEAYSERECARGVLGVRASRELLPLALAEAGRFNKFGA